MADQSLKQKPEQVNARYAVYWHEIRQNMAQLLATLDREKYSLSYGSFDREHWGWKFRDFPITMLQVSMYPVALLWRFPFPDNPLYQNPYVLEWIHAAIENTIRRQHKNGSFDSVGPFTQDHGVSLAMVYALTQTERTLNESVPREFKVRIAEVVERACQFARKSTEDYSFISNHHALFAIALLNASESLQNDDYRQSAEAVIERILQAQSPDGWYREYDGPDPGYESLGIFYLASFWRRTRSQRLLKSLERSIEFLAHCVHPDGSIGGVYGSRHTSLYFPGGLEILASEIPLSDSVAGFMRERLARQNVVTPTVVDQENLPVLLYTYLEACLVPGFQNRSDLPKLPCETLVGLRHFSDSKITFAGMPHYYAVTNAAKGGAIRVFDKSTDVIAYEDAGYVVKTRDRRRWTSQMIGLGHRVETADVNEVASCTQLAEIRQELPTPAKFILLRLLNLSLFRSLRLGAWLRRRIIERLITRKCLGQVFLNRSITFGDNSVSFQDHLEVTQSIKVDEVALPRSFMSIHMGSAKYFHGSDLEPTFSADSYKMAESLNRKGEARLQFAIHFSKGIVSPSALSDIVPQTSSRFEEEVLIQ